MREASAMGESLMEQCHVEVKAHGSSTSFLSEKNNDNDSIREISIG